MVPPDFGRSVNPISTEEGKLCPHITSPPPQIFKPSEIPGVDDVVWNNAAFWKRYGDLRGKEQKASFVSKTTETTTAAANSLLCQGIEPIIMPKLCHAMVPVANAANFLTWQEILSNRLTPAI